MTWGLLLFPAIAGFWFITHFNFTRYTTARQSGYHVLFQSAAYGTALYFGTARLTEICRTQCGTPGPLGTSWLSNPGWLTELILLIDKLPQNPLETEYVLTLALAVILPIILNVVYQSRSGVERAVNNTGEHIEILIINSSKNVTPIEVTLDNRRIYIGIALHSGVGKSPDSDAVIFPYYSGHRDEKTLELVRDTIYTHVLSEHVRQDNLKGAERFRIAIPMSRIVSARPFEQEIFNQFMQMRQIKGNDIPES